MKRFIASFIFATLLLAQPASADVSAAEKFVDTVASKTLGILQSKSSKTTQSKKLEDLLGKHVDVQWIGRFVMGQHWRKTTKNQQKSYLKNYERFILKSYAKRFTEYKGSGYKILKSREDSKNKYTVKMTIDIDGKPTKVDYKIRKKSGKFRIYDLIVEGVSLITTQRSEFGSILSNKGVDHLIKQLANKAKEL